MNRKEIGELRDKIGTDPMLTDEEIEYIWMPLPEIYKSDDDEELFD